MERGSVAEPKQKAKTGALRVAGLWMLGRQGRVEAGEWRCPPGGGKDLSLSNGNNSTGTSVT